MAGKMRSAIALSPILLIAGCGWFGGGDGEDGGPNFAPIYQTFDSRTATTSEIASTGLRVGSDGTVSVTEGRGTLAHATNRLNLDDGTYDFNDSGLPIGANLYTDGAVILTRGTGTLDTSGYEYVTGYSVPYTDNGVVYTTEGLMGIATRLNDMPTNRTGQYTGTASATILRGATTTQLQQGTSEVRADFGTGSVDVNLSNFQSVTGAVDPGIDRIEAVGLAIRGNTFSGDNVGTRLGGNGVTIIGPPDSRIARGAFYGYDADEGIPDEVGGIVNMSGPLGRVTGTFVAD